MRPFEHYGATVSREITAAVRRSGIGKRASIVGDRVVVHSRHDRLAAPWGTEYTMILANPPFDKCRSVMIVNEEGDTEKTTPSWFARTSGPMSS